MEDAAGSRAPLPPFPFSTDGRAPSSTTAPFLRMIAGFLGALSNASPLDLTAQTNPGPELIGSEGQTKRPTATSAAGIYGRASRFLYLTET